MEMARGPALVFGELSFPIHRFTNIIGRRNQTDVPTVDLAPLDRDRVVSRKHAEICYRDGTLVVVDLEARNGVFVNGRRLGPREERNLDENDSLSFGGVSLTFRAEATWPDGLVPEWGTTGFDNVEVTMAAGDTLSGQLHEAIARHQLVLHYQPKITLATGVVEGVEALCRWNHPARGLLYPDSFLGMAEATGFIRAITSWGVDAALAQCAAWHADGLDLCMSCNISIRDLEDARFIKHVTERLAAHAVEPSKLIIEITESGLMSDPRRAIEHCEHLKAAGVRISIDDFGTGHSSLSYLQQVPADELKIDKSFVMKIDANNLAILRSAINVGHDLGMRVTAEGVEEESTVTLLKELGCDVGQGYFFSRPVAADKLTASLKR
jgi:EAL domain-containing protein (putative c-di-GMP-specific phosphodiesterase class I)